VGTRTFDNFRADCVFMIVLTRRGEAPRPLEVVGEKTLPESACSFVKSRLLSFYCSDDWSPRRRPALPFLLGAAITREDPLALS